MTVVAIRDEHDVAVQAAALAIRPGQEFWTDKQRAALTVLGIKDASNADLAVFMHYCQKTGLDPFSRQVYMIARRDQGVIKQTIQTGIDGFRVIRDRVAARLGVTVEYEDTVWYDAEGREHKVWLWDDAPVACKVVVIKDGKRYPAVVRTASYMAMKDGKPVSQWRTQADHMIEKCAEAYALRRAFPHDLGGLYIEDEMTPPATIQARSERVTAADILAAPQTPAAQAGRTAEPPDADVADPQPASPVINQAGKRDLDKMDALFEQLQLDTEEQDAVVHWFAPGEWTASAAQIRQVVKGVTPFLTDAGGDVAEARTQMWDAYRRMQEATSRG